MKSILGVAAPLMGILLFAVTSCSASSASSEGAVSCDPTATPTTGDLPDDVNAVLVDKCQGCHSGPPQHHAPFPLVSFEDTQEQFGLTSKRKWQRMSEVIAPDGLPHMPYGTAPPLTSDEMTTLQSWFGKCAMPVPEGMGHDLLDDGGVEQVR